MITTTYTTRDEAVEREIVAAIEAAGPDVARADDYDVDAIACEVLGVDERGRWRVDVDSDEFWRSVEAHATYRVEVAYETVNTGDVEAIAYVISRAIPDADAPVHAEEISARPGALETDWAVRVGNARLIIGPDHEYPDGICWVIYRTAADQDTGEIYTHGGWAVSDRDTARREIAEIIDTLTRLGTTAWNVALRVVRDVDAAEYPVTHPTGEWHEVHAGPALLAIGGDDDGVSWSIYRNADDDEELSSGGWTYDEPEVAEREIALIIETLARLGAEE